MKKIIKVVLFAVLAGCIFMGASSCSQNIQDEILEEESNSHEENEFENLSSPEINKYHRGGVGGRGPSSSPSW